MEAFECFSSRLLSPGKANEQKAEKMKRRFLLLICLFFSFAPFGFSQQQEPLTYEDFIKIVREHHPIMQKSLLIRSAADANLLKSKGNFDPKITHETDGKNFNQKNYYQFSHTALKIPTWFGLEVKGGYELNRGDFISAEHQTPASGLWYGGLSMPLGKNLFIDERRKTLRQAQLMIGQSEIDQRIMQSDLILHSSEAYWDWYRAFHALEISNEGLRLAEERLNAIRISAELGEHAKIDTLEATLQRDTRTVELEQAKANHAYYRAGLGVYLWGPNQIPLEPKENSFPPKTDSTHSIYHNITIDTTVWIRQYDYKLELLKIEERFKKEQLKPELNLVYNPLIQPVSGGLMPFSTNNMKYGLTASFPIFLRKERGDLNSVQIKLKEAQIDRSVKSLEIRNKVYGISQMVFSLGSQIRTQESIIESSKKMRDAELVKFELGESSLFLVNSRELKYLESKLKGIELMAKYRIYQAQLDWLQTD
jgi:outer membrane protein TolC